MIPNVVRGDRMAGLMTYLVGPGRTNEHTEPHLVAGDGALMAWHSDNELGRDSALAIARDLDRPSKAFDVDVNGGHVWHCSLSLHVDEGMLTDEDWGKIANDFVTAMEFDNVEDTKAPCRWVAVRHGVSKNGNDHIHIAVNLVREDGTKASTHHDFRRAQTAARALEVKYGLAVVAGPEQDRSTRGYQPAEREARARSKAQAEYERLHPGERWESLPAADRQSRIRYFWGVDEPRVLLATRVRAASTSSTTEAEFVRRMRGDGLIVRPRFADGTSDVVTGYSVAERPIGNERPIWYGGGHLGRDLTLPRLRAGWEDTPTGSSEAAAEWQAARRGRRVVAPGREVTAVTQEQFDVQARQLGAIIDQLRAAPLDDRDLWVQTARQASGTLAAWSNALEETPGPLAEASKMLGRSAQTYRREDRSPFPHQQQFSMAASMMSAAALTRGGTAAYAALIMNMTALTLAIGKALHATAERRDAERELATARTQLELVHSRLAVVEAPAPPVASAAPEPAAPLDPELQKMLDRIRAGRPGAGSAQPPIPGALPDRPRTRTGPQTDRGIGR